MPDVRDNEPLEALDGGEEGIDVYSLLFSGLQIFKNRRHRDRDR